MLFTIKRDKHNVKMLFAVKGALCGFREEILMRRERSSLSDYFFLKLNKLNENKLFLFS